MKLKNILRLFFFLFPFFMYAQIDSVNIGGVYHCSRDFLHIVEENKKVITYFLPEDFESDPLNFKIDSAYINLGKSNYLQQTYTSEKIRFKTLINEQKKSFIIKNQNSNKKAKIDFTEPCDITFTGIKHRYKENILRFFFIAKYDGYEQEFSLQFGKFGNRKGIILNSGHPQYRKCTP